MKLLSDTQCWLWWFAQPERLNEDAIAQIADETNELWVSVASIWEIGIKVAIYKTVDSDSITISEINRIKGTSFSKARSSTKGLYFFNSFSLLCTRALRVE